MAGSTLMALSLLLSMSMLMPACLGTYDDVGQEEHAIGVATLSIEPSVTSVAAGGNLSFDIQFSANNEPLNNVVLRFSMEDLNDLLDNDDTGLAEDAEVDYGSGTFDFRPVQFVAASQGPNGVSPIVPAANSPSGEVVWNIGTLNDGFTGTVIVTVLVPTGYIGGKTIQGRAHLEHDMVVMLDETSTTTATVIATEDYSVRTSTPAPIQPPGATNVWARFGFRNLQSTLPNTMDAEDIAITVNGGGGTCIPTFQAANIVTAGGYPAKYTNQLGATPGVGAPLDASNPVSAHFDRLPFTINEGQKYLYVLFTIPNTCIDGQTIRMHPDVTMYGGSKTLSGPDVIITIGEELCRDTTVRAFRAQSGDPIMNDYNPWPSMANQDPYIASGSARPGEYVIVTTPLGSSANQTRVLDASYYHYIIPEGMSFHGIRFYSFLGDAALGVHGAYKDCDGNALAPDDPLFDHNDPEMSGWNRVRKTWAGPFTGAPSDAVDNAVVQPGCELLFIKRNDSPAGTPPDNGAWQVRSIFQACDGTYCPIKSNLSTPINTDAGYTYTVADVATPMVNACGVPNAGGHAFYVAAESYPLIDMEPTLGVVLAGDVAQLDINPGNSNLGSQYVDGRWYVDFFPHRDYVNLDGVLGQVLTADGAMPLQWPAADQNVPGQSCSPIADITFHPPDAATCNAAGDPGCLAWFEVPDGCQPPNGYYGAGTIPTQDEHIPYLKFRISVPVNRDIPPGTILDIEAQVRHSDGVTMGADNAAPVTRWSDTNYSDIGSVEVLSDPDAQVHKTGPAVWSDGSLMYYTLEGVNEGNVSLRGIYLIDEMPRMGLNGSDFTPIYRRVYSDRPASDVVVESSTDATCFSSDQGLTWTPVGAMEASGALIGYQSRTNIDVPAGALCIRIHLANGTAVAPGQSMFVAVGVEIPAGTPQGQRLGNRALVAAAAGLNGAVVELTAPGLSEILETVVDNTPVVRVDKTFEIDPTRAGYIKWILRYYNASGATATNAVVTDTLPGMVVYDGLASPLDPGESCTDGVDGMGNCLAINGNTEVRFTIASLTPFDGAQGTGTDEGVVEIWTVNQAAVPPNTTLQNCANATPTSSPPLPSGCADTRTIDFGMTKTITGDPMTVNIGDTMEYVITTTNNTPDLYYVTVYDLLSANVSYVPGSLLINGSQASDNLISGNELNYQIPVGPAETLEIRLTVQVNGPMGGGVIGNTAVGSGCTNPLVPTTCAPAIASAEVQVTVPVGQVCGNGTIEGTEDCDDAGESATCDADCTSVTCGDGTTNTSAGEMCDDAGESATCDADCSAAMCGDSTINNTAGEECDDGNMTPGDGCQPTCLLAACGDTYLDPIEGCDDGNLNDGDGCTASCLVEDGNGCNDIPPGQIGDNSCDSGNCDTAGNPAPGVCEPLDTCGNGLLETGEDCDDGGNVAGDGCRADCTLEVCGDGIQDPGEGCDDNNNTNGDGCSATCVLESCGDGILHPGEGCDDGNAMPGDGCSPGCLVETGSSCNDTVPGTTGDGSCESGICDDTDNPAPGVCEAINTCGNSVPEGAEECDDGNTTDGDGCQGTCLLPVCGDGIVDSGAGEACDDGNTTDGDGCQATCQLPACGDNVLDAGEGCDDGNTGAGDGCGAACLIESDNPCNNDGAGGGLDDNASCESDVCDTTGNPAPGVCEDADSCGNSVVEGAEQCDDGNTDDNDGCSATCTVESPCGNGVLDAAEGCDDSNNTDGDGCNMDCLIEDGSPCNDSSDGATGNDSCASSVCDETDGAPGVCEAANTCGNGVIEGSESCDDGNTEDGDTCPAGCFIDDGPVCGDGEMEGDEQCDDGNTNSGDGCSATCAIDGIGVSGGGCSVSGQNSGQNGGQNGDTSSALLILMALLGGLFWRRRRDDLVADAA